jgi:hypothetical protein
MIPEANRNPGTIYVRYMGSAAVTASPFTAITIPRRPAAPTNAEASFDGINEVINVSSPGTMLYRRGTTGAFNSVPGGQIPGNVAGNSQRVQLRFAATATAFESSIATVTVPGRRSAPQARYDASNDRIVGVTNAMEFSTVGAGGPWTDITANNITRAEFGAATIVWVRIRATATLPVSTARAVTVFTAPGAGPASPVLDMPNEVVLSVTNQMEWRIGTRVWRPINADTLNISAHFPSPGASGPTTLSIRMRATDTTAASEATIIMLPIRGYAPTTSGPGTNVVFDGFTETVSVDSTMEFRRGRSGAWTPVAGGVTTISDVVATQQRTYQVRYRGTATTPPSEILEVIIPARRFPPSVTFSVANDRLTRTSAAMEFRFAPTPTGVFTAWQPIAHNFVPRDAFGAGFADGGIIEIRTAATATTPVGYIRSITIPPV